METKGNYVLIGLFALCVVVAAFGFVFWFHNIGGTAKRNSYVVRFDGSAAGLRAGSAVLFNGIRMGEVKKVVVNPDDPHQVLAYVEIDVKAPIRTDTAVGLDFQGLTGIASIAMTGGSKEAPPFVTTFSEPPMLLADASASQDVTRAARDVLKRIDAQLAEGGSLYNTFKNVETFSETLANNSKRIDNILAGLENLSGGSDGAGDIQEAARSLKTLADNLDKRTDDISAGINKFTAVGAKELENVGYSARRTMGEIEKAVKNFDANPSRILWGGSSNSSSSSSSNPNTNTNTNTNTKPIATSKPIATPTNNAKPIATPTNNAKPSATPSSNAKPVATSSSNAKSMATSQ
jgi:phospholipid/cholesterol/gamma-HCH transport system substrate-binding protein